MTTIRQTMLGLALAASVAAPAFAQMTAPAPAQTPAATQGTPSEGTGLAAPAPAKTPAMAHVRKVSHRHHVHHTARPAEVAPPAAS